MYGFFAWNMWNTNWPTGTLHYNINGHPGHVPENAKCVSSHMRDFTSAVRGCYTPKEPTESATDSKPICSSVLLGSKMKQAGNWLKWTTRETTDLNLRSARRHLTVRNQQENKNKIWQFEMFCIFELRFINCWCKTLKIWKKCVESQKRSPWQIGVRNRSKFIRSPPPNANRHSQTFTIEDSPPPFTLSSPPPPPWSGRTGEREPGMAWGPS